MWVGHEVIPSRLSIMSEEKVRKAGGVSGTSRRRVKIV